MRPGFCNAVLPFPARQNSNGEDGLTKLYVGNLPYDASETQLQEWFSQAGVHVTAVSILRDRFSGQPRGYGYAEAANNANATRAVKICNGRNFQGRTLIVNEAPAAAPEDPPRAKGARKR